MRRADRVVHPYKGKFFRRGDPCGRPNRRTLGNRCLPCLKGGGPTELWWRDSVRGRGFIYRMCGAGDGTHGSRPTIRIFCRAGPAGPAVGAGKKSPSHGFAVPAPFRQGGQGCGRPQGSPLRSVFHLIEKPRRVRVRRREKLKSFFTATCAWGKIPLRLPVWNFVACDKIMRAADCKPLWQKIP